MIRPAKFKMLTALVLLSLATQASPANPNDFTVRSVTSTNIFKLSEAKGKFVALHFLLKTECPYCIRHTHDYVQKSAGDARVVQVSSSQTRTRRSRRGHPNWTR
jgi:peroxiredoxin Q/BCP